MGVGVAIMCGTLLKRIIASAMAAQTNFISHIRIVRLGIGNGFV